jgi:hypothetical protein
VKTLPRLRNWKAMATPWPVQPTPVHMHSQQQMWARRLHCLDNHGHNRRSELSLLGSHFSTPTPRSSPTAAPLFSAFSPGWDLLPA